MPSPLALAVRAYARYALPFLALSVVAFSPLLLLDARLSHGAIDVTRARAELHIAWQSLAVVWIFQLALVAAVAPAIRSLTISASSARLSQWHALRDGIRNLVIAIVPCCLAVACILLGGLALALPALVIFPLLALTGASRELDAQLPAPLLDSIAVARRQIVITAAIAFGMIALDLAITALAQRALVPELPAQPSPTILLRFNTFLRVTIAAIVVVSPLLASALVAVYERATARGA